MQSVSMSSPCSENHFAGFFLWLHLAFKPTEGVAYRNNHVCHYGSLTKALDAILRLVVY